MLYLNTASEAGNTINKRHAAVAYPFPHPAFRNLGELTNRRQSASSAHAWMGEHGTRKEGKCKGIRRTRKGQNGRKTADDKKTAATATNEHNRNQERKRQTAAEANNSEMRHNQNQNARVTKESNVIIKKMGRKTF